MDLSNKSLALLLLATIVISLGGTLLSLKSIQDMSGFQALTITGKATGSGWAAVNITNIAGCSVDSNVDFGTNQTTGSATIISSDANNIGSGFVDCISSVNSACVGMTVNNTGNLFIDVNFSSSDAASTFLGGASVVAGDFQFRTFNGSANATRNQEGCLNSSGLTAAYDWGNVVTAQTLICNNFSFQDATDLLTIEYNITLKPDTPGGQKNATITVNCNQV